MISRTNFFLYLLIALLAGCGGSSSSSGGNGGTTTPPPTSEPSLNRYALANGCYALRPDGGALVQKASDGGFSADATLTDAERFFMRPATLGKYLFYDRDGALMTVTSNDEIAANAQPSDNAIWTIDFNDSAQTFSISTTDGSPLGVSDGRLVLGEPDDTKTAFRFDAASGCTPYPEMPVAVSGTPFRGNGVDKPLLGFADVHTHMGMSSEMSYAGNVGPSAGGVLYGEVIHRFGVTHALDDCQDIHGPQGIRDANNILEGDPTGNHNTEGWPTFIDWPARNFLTHQVMYYKWVERAYLSGLRLMVNHGTNIKALCEVGKTYSLNLDADCNDMSVAIKQVEYLYEVQDYVDAQSGGPGEGWFRIVTSPQQAREVINDGKLAVILGVEVAQVFNCGVTILADGSEQRQCDTAQIDSEIQRLWDLGVRHVYPYHDINSSLGGTGIFSGDVINFLNFLDTGQFWETTECRSYPEDEPSVREPGVEMTTALPGAGNDPLTEALLDASGGILPVYQQGIRCNARTVTELGDYAMRALMARGMVIDIDHAAYHSKDIMLDIAEELEPAYPMASSHDAHGGLTSDQAVRMLADGGIIYPYKGTGVKHREFLEKLKFWRQQAGVESTVLGLGYGADGNGFGGHPGPRGGDAEPVRYPFTLFQGSEWGPQFDGIDPVTVDLLTVPESGKFWHIDEVGMAHYGLVADFVEEVRLEGGREALDALFNSAEAYVQMWERAYHHPGTAN